MDNTPAKPSFQWDDEKVSRLIEMDAKGLSASKIAEEIGCPTRAAVIGKIRRLGLRAIRGDRGNKTRAKFGNHHAKAARTKLFRAPPPAPSVGGLTIMDLKSHHCRWPTGEKPWRFCGAQRWGGSSYCCNHTRMAWRREL